ncbi:elongation factor P [Lacticaseibacillus thailandensis]|uniref:Elongation factor P n=1 Tax=Lacticaseibacillus thailandensis DSM 22698 = JCM 13996 TaxID=1423810 RepID=A0A0R2CDC8_9LACO|nr:elongation factor P [Lacticaseibacillus thailandensis]KRM87988.1 translation elongation factor P [Lacticaseibacillus thailandensis DSM 22698 = JCM 13996]
MIEAINLKAGMAFEKDGKLIKVLFTNHHKPGKGNTVMQMKLYDVRSGAIVQTTMRPTEKVEQAVLDKKQAQFLYSQDDTAYFMDTETYDQYELPIASISDEMKFLLPDTMVEIEFYGNEVIGITLPSTVTLAVKETSPAIKGATVSGGGKPATLETGLVVQVPDFIKEGDKLIINTDRGGTYAKRAD